MQLMKKAYRSRGGAGEIPIKGSDDFGTGDAADNESAHLGELIAE